MKKKFCPDVDIKDMFFIYILEEFKSKKKMTGKDAILFFEISGIKDYIYDFYESLHTMGTQAILEDIEEFILNHSVT